MTEMSDLDRIQELLKRADTITAESRELRQHIEHIRAAEREWPRRRQGPPGAPPERSPSDFAGSSSDGMTQGSPEGL